MARGDAHPYLLPILYTKNHFTPHIENKKSLYLSELLENGSSLFVVKNTTTLSVELLDYAISLC